MAAPPLASSGSATAFFAPSWRAAASSVDAAVGSGRELQREYRTRLTGGFISNPENGRMSERGGYARFGHNPIPTRRGRHPTDFAASSATRVSVLQALGTVSLRPVVSLFAGIVTARAASNARQKHRHKWLRRGNSARVPLPRRASGGTMTPADANRFVWYRNLTFLGMVFGYAVYYFTRLSFTYVGLAMRSDMGLSMIQLGAISSFFPLAYMNSKFLSGVLSDLLGSPVLIFSIGLVFTGLLNIAFALGNTVPWFTVIWLLNGLFQGCGATPCNKMLMNWFPSSSRGKWWSGWNASHNIGGFGIPLLAGGLAAAYGWRWGMIAPGVIAVCMGLLTLGLMRDSPEKLGLPSAEEHAKALRFNGMIPPAAEEEQNQKEIHIEDPHKDDPVLMLLLRNRFLWLMAAMHFFIYFIRQGVLNWAHFYIMDQFGVPAVEATFRVSGFELGGLLGCIFSGQVSDWLICRYPNAGAAGLRTQVMIYYSLLATAAVLGLWLLPPAAALQWLCMFCFGFAIYGPQTLITMTGVETVPPHAAATAGGLLAYPAQLGSMCAGLPFALLVQEYGWSGFFPSLVVLSLISAVIVIPGWRTKSYVQANS